MPFEQKVAGLTLCLIALAIVVPLFLYSLRKTN